MKIKREHLEVFRKNNVPVLKLFSTKKIKKLNLPAFKNNLTT